MFRVAEAWILHAQDHTVLWRGDGISYGTQIQFSSSHDHMKIQEEILYRIIKMGMELVGNRTSALSKRCR